MKQIKEVFNKKCNGQTKTTNSLLDFNLILEMKHLCKLYFQINQSDIEITGVFGKRRFTIMKMNNEKFRKTVIV